MPQDDYETDVIFRVWGRQREVFALMPQHLGTYSPYTCTSYVHVGQHGSADPQHCVMKSKPARPDQYHDLQAELEGLGYSVRVVRKLHPKYLEARKIELAQIEASA